MPAHELNDWIGAGLSSYVIDMLFWKKQKLKLSL